MAMLGENFNTEISKLKHDLYFNALEDFTIGEFEQAVYLAIKSLKFFPKVAELRELIEGDPKSQALLAWITAVDNRNWYATVEFEDKLIHYCLIEIFGGWMEFCEKTLEELKWQAKRFLQLYELGLKRPDIVHGVSQKFIGWNDTHNIPKGFPARKVILIESTNEKDRLISEIETVELKQLTED